MYNKEEPLKTNDCVKKGNICSAEEIYKGVEVEIAVNDKTKQRFYVISNDENQMTLIMNKNIKKEADWSAELINIKGPGEAYAQLIDKTKNWNNIDYISEYKYEDSGKKTFEEICQDPTNNGGYDCSTTRITSRGYNDVTINDGKVTLNYNIYYEPTDEKPQLSNELVGQTRARIITNEEINAVVQNNETPLWLIKNLGDKEGYWTATSSIAQKTSYDGGAVALVKMDNKPSIESIYVMKDYDAKYEIGIRPVITVNKK